MATANAISVFRDAARLLEARRWQHAVSAGGQGFGGVAGVTDLQTEQTGLRMQIAARRSPSSCLIRVRRRRPPRRGAAVVAAVDSAAGAHLAHHGRLRG